jgi:hypothetical protein
LTETADEIMLLDSLQKEISNIDTLSLIAESYLKADDKTKAIRIYRKMGKLSRNENDFFNPHYSSRADFVQGSHLICWRGYSFSKKEHIDASKSYFFSVSVVIL